VKVRITDYMLQDQHWLAYVDAIYHSGMQVRNLIVYVICFPCVAPSILV